MRYLTPPLLLAAALAAGCAERPTPFESTGPGTSPPELQAGFSPNPGLSERARHQRIARRLARALADDGFRARVYRAIHESPEREGKVLLQRFLGRAGNDGRRHFADLAGEPEVEVSTDLDASSPLELYLPVPAHRRAWAGDAALLVATLEADREAPVGFDVQGRRVELDADAPPALPVLAVVRAEQEFGAIGVANSTCIDACDDTPTGGESGGGGSGGSANLVSPGLYMTYAQFNETFESWLKGDPEFEVHMLGQEGNTQAMKSYQCAGEKAGAPYQYNQDATQWSGSVMLFSKTQLDTYQAAHPTQAIRVFVVEDDDASCVIKTDSVRVSKMFQQLVDTYGDLTGGKKVDLISSQTFTKAKSILKLYQAIWSFFTSADDIVGTAIEDVVAREYFPNANWVVKGENNITKGALRLEIR
jgi:hypothetical protein